jgi:hypothetical protein
MLLSNDVFRVRSLQASANGRARRASLTIPDPVTFAPVQTKLRFSANTPVRGCERLHWPNGTYLTFRSVGSYGGNGPHAERVCPAAASCFRKNRPAARWWHLGSSAWRVTASRH